MENEEKIELILEKLEKLEKKVEDNNSILHGDRNSKRWAKLFWIIKWIIIVASGIIAWSYIQPIYKSTVDNYNKTVENINKAGAALDKLPSADDFSLESIKNKLTN